MSSPTDRRYAESHEWHKQEGDVVVIGISKFAVEELTDVTYVEFFKDAGEIGKGETFGEIESVKATSEIYSGIAGEIVETNQAVIDDPSLLNQDSYDKGWLIKVKPSDPSQLDDLMDASDYDAQHS